MSTPSEFAGGRLTPDGVRTMFDRIAPVYDVMNRVTTMGLDRGWRRLAADSVVRPGDRVLDACCGTGDLALAAERAGGVVTGLDFAGSMLARARRKSASGRKSASVDWVQGDVTALPFEDACFDAATVGFGIRNVPDLEKRPRRARARPASRRAARLPRPHATARDSWLLSIASGSTA